MKMKIFPIISTQICRGIIDANNFLIHLPAFNNNEQCVLHRDVEENMPIQTE